MRFDVSLPADHFDLELCVSSGQVFRWSRQADGGWVGVDGERWYRVWERRPGPSRDDEFRPATTLVRATGMNRDRGRDALAYVAEPHKTYDQTTYAVETNGTREDFENLFRLDWDAAIVRAEILRRGPEVEPYLGTLEGLRLMRPSDPVETFFSFLCTPNNNIPRIVTMVVALASYGPPIANTELRRFPEVERIAEIPEAELRERKFGYRAATIPRAAQELVRRGGRDYLEDLKTAPYEAAHAALLSFHGVGPKLADCIALFALHHTCAVPVDTHLWHAATRLYFPDWERASITALKYQAVNAHLRGRFGDLTGWAHQHLFFDSVLNWRSRLK